MQNMKVCTPPPRPSNENVEVFFLAYRGRTILGLGSSSIPMSLLLALGLGGGIGLLLIPTALPAIRNAVLRIYNPDGTRKRVQPVSKSLSS